MSEEQLRQAGAYYYLDEGDNESIASDERDRLLDDTLSQGEPDNAAPQTTDVVRIIPPGIPLVSGDVRPKDTFIVPSTPPKTPWRPAETSPTNSHKTSRSSRHKRSHHRHHQHKSSSRAHSASPAKEAKVQPPLAPLTITLAQNVSAPVQPAVISAAAAAPARPADTLAAASAPDNMAAQRRAPSSPTPSEISLDHRLAELQVVAATRVEPMEVTAAADQTAPSTGTASTPSVNEDEAVNWQLPQNFRGCPLPCEARNLQGVVRLLTAWITMLYSCPYPGCLYKTFHPSMPPLER